MFRNIDYSRVLKLNLTKLEIKNMVDFKRLLLEHVCQFTHLLSLKIRYFEIGNGDYETLINIAGLKKLRFLKVIISSFKFNPNIKIPRIVEDLI